MPALEVGAGALLRGDSEVAATRETVTRAIIALRSFPIGSALEVIAASPPSPSSASASAVAHERHHEHHDQGHPDPYPERHVYASGSSG